MQSVTGEVNCLPRVFQKGFHWSWKTFTKGKSCQTVYQQSAKVYFSTDLMVDWTCPCVYVSRLFTDCNFAIGLSFFFNLYGWSLTLHSKFYFIRKIRPRISNRPCENVAFIIQLMNTPVELCNHHQFVLLYLKKKKEKKEKEIWNIVGIVTSSRMANEWIII